MNKREIYLSLVVLILLSVLIKINWDTFACKCQAGGEEIFVWAITIIFGLLAIIGQHLTEK